MAKSRGRRSRERKSLRRATAVDAPRRTVLVFCEGTKTEPDYLRALKRERVVREVASVEIRVAGKGSSADPFALVTAAVKAHDLSTRGELEVDEIWCLYDVEWPQNHSHLPEAAELAKRHGIRVAISNPCFELWLVLHFQDQTAWLDTAAATRLRRQHDPRTDKGLDGATYMPRRDAVARRARSLDARHEGNGTGFPNDNPSSGMYRFLDAIERPADDDG